MNIKKIREALELSRKVGVKMEWDDVRDRCEEALAELDKAQQPGKLLTDDMVSTVANLEKSLHLRENGLEKEADIWARGVMSGMIQARDNGYLAPAAGLTVEEVKRLLRDAVWRTGNGKALKDFYARHGGL